MYMGGSHFLRLALQEKLGGGASERRLHTAGVRGRGCLPLYPGYCGLVPEQGQAVCRHQCYREIGFFFWGFSPLEQAVVSCQPGDTKLAQGCGWRPQWVD